MTYDERVLWSDPFPEPMRTGVLLADQIKFFVDAAHLIEPSTFTSDDLRPAAYDLHIGDTYYVDDKPLQLGSGDGFKIPANGLVYIKTRERFNIPYYLVARYSLRVTQVYRGLLIDNGLHIDPGYHGPIYVPVHNFTDQDRPLSEGQAFLSAEFARTTPFPSGSVARIWTEAELVTKHGKPGLDGYAGNKVILFNKSVDDLRRVPRTPKDFWNKFPGEEHKSATMGTEVRLANVRNEVSEQQKTLLREVRTSIDRAGFLSFASLLAVLLALVSIFLPRYLDTVRTSVELTQKVQSLTVEVQDLKKQAATQSAPAPIPSRPATPPQPLK